MTHARRDRRAVWAAILRAIEDGEPHQMSEVVYEVRTNYSLIAKHCEALQIVGFLTVTRKSPRKISVQIKHRGREYLSRWDHLVAMEAF